MFLTTHHLTITDHNGKTIRGKVFYMQPQEERWHTDYAEVHFVTLEWLDTYRYQAVYVTLMQSTRSFFLVHNYQLVEGGAYLFEGPFERTS